MKILIVEDDFISRRLLHKLLAPLGDCDIAVDGLEAVQAVDYALKEKKPYELICLDIMMPRMDGFSALKRIREKETQYSSQLPLQAKIVITSALKDPERIVDSEYANFANAYVEKPINRVMFMNELRNLGLLASEGGESDN